MFMWGIRFYLNYLTGYNGHMEENGGGYGGWIIGIIIGLVIAHFFFPNKYEDQTAEEWFNAYDEQEAITEEKLNCLSDIESEAGYYYSEDYEGLQNKLRDIESMASGCQ